MSDAGFVIGGWTLTAVVLAGYMAHLWSRSRRLQRLLRQEEECR